MSFNRFEPELGAEKALSLVSDQWFIFIVHALMKEKMRFSDLLKLNPHISRKMLTQTLKKMERDGFVVRTVLSRTPHRTEYELSMLGQSIVPPLQQLCRWANENYNTVLANRQAAESTQSNLK